MKPASGDGNNKSTESQWSNVPKIGGVEFEQCVAVAQLAVKLCELQKRELENKWDAEDRKHAHDIQTAVTESEKKRVNDERNKQMGSRIATLAPEGFLATAWQLIQKAGEHVLRPQTLLEYVVDHGGGAEPLTKAISRDDELSRIPFHMLCNPDRNKGDIDLINGVSWKVFTTERGFDKLFWAYWRDKSVLKLRTIMSASEVLGNEPDKWESYGKQMLASWKRDGIRPGDFLALATFRREHDKRAENLR